MLKLNLELGGGSAESNSASRRHRSEAKEAICEKFVLLEPIISTLK
jgi:hypothetical protein